MGIPAVVGTGQASFVLQDGQWVRLDGTTGQVQILGQSNRTIA
jgi:phosphoenolpyruvate-protein kinase (PTS system EI component)